MSDSLGLTLNIRNEMKICDVLLRHNSQLYSHWNFLVVIGNFVTKITLKKKKPILNKFDLFYFL